MRVLLVGQAPGPNTDPDLPLYPVPVGSAGGRLMTLMGLTRVEYLSLFDRVNLLREFPGQRGVKKERTVDHLTDHFPLREARIAADAIKRLAAGRHLVLMGSGVAKAFGIKAGGPLLEWQPLRLHNLYNENLHGPRELTYMVAPHTSGRSRWYNDPVNRERAVASLAGVVALARDLRD